MDASIVKQVSQLKKSFLSKHHSHPLHYLNQAEKNYTSTGWFCDLCNLSCSNEVKCMHCKVCGWDLCDACFGNEFQYPE